VAVLAAPAPAPRRTVTAATVRGGRRPAEVKSTSWAWSSRAAATARSRAADTAILVEDGRVLEAAAANVVLRVGGRTVTPPADGRILPGTTRALLLDAVEDLEEGAVDVEQLHTSEEVVLVAAVRGAVPVVVLDGRPVGDGAPGPLAGRLRAALREHGVGPR
jgi:branched-subunit amino acid aminotransferase/4-amino-4-deoxychorismate lyase